MKKKILVRGPALSISGYGDHCLFVLRSLKKYPDLFDIYLLNINWGQTSWDWRDTAERQWIDSLLQKTIQYIQAGGKFDMSCQISIPNEFEQLAPINIGITAGIESSRISPAWIEKSVIMDKIITVSNFSKDIFVNTSYTAQNKQTGEVIQNFRCEKPVEVVGYPCKPLTFVPTGGIKLEKFDFPCDFNFLVVSQWGPRKNIDNTIKWFVEEFIDQEVGLVVKTSLRNQSVIDRMATEAKIVSLLKPYSNRKCKVHLIHGSMDNEEIADLYGHPKIKAFVSLSHGEGFGLGMFEAACHGLPVITPSYGGQADFLCAPVRDKKTKQMVQKQYYASVEYALAPVQQEAVWPGVIEKDSQWCFPKETSYKRRLREVIREYNRFKIQAKGLQKYLLETFTEEKQYKLLVETIIGQKVVTVDVKDLPKVSIVTSLYKAAEFMENLCKDVTSQNIFKEKCEWVVVHVKTSPEFEREQEILKPYLEKYDNIVYHVLDEDPGMYACWNKAIQLSSGEVCTNWNVDDTRASNMIEVCAKELHLSSDVGGVYIDSYITQKPNETFENNSSNGRKYSFPPYNFQTLKMMNILHANPLWRKELHEKYGYFREDLKSAADWEFFLRCGSKGVQFKKVDDCLGLYYFNPDGVSTSTANAKWKNAEEREVYNQYKDLKV